MKSFDMWVSGFIFLESALGIPAVIRINLDKGDEETEGLNIAS